MAYIRFDQMDYGAGTPMFTADGQITTHYSLTSSLPQIQKPCIPFPTPMGRPEDRPRQPVLPNIRNMKELYGLFGEPDATDKDHGGIAIWSAASLKKAGYGFLHRVEIIDESVPSVVPIKHFSNVYIWVTLKPTQEQLNNILGLSKDFYYDRKKELLVVRSACLDTAIAQATLMSLYATGKISFYDLVNNDMLASYYVGILPGKPACRKVRKALYRILKDIKKMK
jgi:hypothetical protein